MVLWVLLKRERDQEMFIGFIAYFGVVLLLVEGTAHVDDGTLYTRREEQRHDDVETRRNVGQKLKSSTNILCGVKSHLTLVCVRTMQPDFTDMDSGWLDGCPPFALARKLVIHILFECLFNKQSVVIAEYILSDNKRLQMGGQISRIR